MPEMLSLPPGNPPKRTFLYYATLVVGAVVVIGGLWMIEARLRSPGAPVAVVPDTAPLEAPSAFDDIVAVKDQAAGRSVLVSMVDVQAPGVWVVVHELKDGGLWNALGAARAKGPAQDIRVDLLRNTLAGKEYAVVLYRDDGDEIYELHGDSAYVDFGSGERVEAYFTAN